MSFILFISETLFFHPCIVTTRMLELSLTIQCNSIDHYCDFIYHYHGRRSTSSPGVPRVVNWEALAGFVRAGQNF